jgi:hypothetical protein
MATTEEDQEIESLSMVKVIAGLRLEGEDDGMDEGTTVEWDARDTYETLANLIEQARKIVNHPGFSPQPAVDGCDHGVGVPHFPCSVG